VKITKLQLKQLIREEMNERMNEAWGEARAEHWRDVDIDDGGIETMRQMGIAQDQENYGGPEVGGDAITPYSEMARAALRGDATKEGSGPWKALQRLKSLSSVEPEAQAMLDAVYEESPRLKPKAGLSPQAGAGIDAFIDEEVLAEEMESLQKGKTKMKITQSTLKQLIKEVYKTDMLQEQEVMTVEKQIKYLADEILKGDQDRLDLRMAIEDLYRRIAELKKGV